jgi:hypothetical protein
MRRRRDREQDSQRGPEREDRGDLRGNRRDRENPGESRGERRREFGDRFGQRGEREFGERFGERGEREFGERNSQRGDRRGEFGERFGQRGEGSRLGLSLTPGEGGGGAVVAAVEPNSRAAQLGFQPGDVIIDVEGKPVSSAQDVRRAMRDARADGKNAVVVRVKSQQGTRTITIPLGRA